ncbi:UDP-N-acetylmuramate dehydrogenase [Utexia brackfieldae]|uniref:UDP-N-acetylmuramate dehydrogenase n=1 Tax=Utexia brackfieldae TaxID=3074108 RepID=UPI00370DCF40
MKPLIPNTFGLSVYAKQVETATSVAQLFQYWQRAKAQNLPVLILGQGSNTLFTSDFDGVVILNRIMGTVVRETESHILLHVGAGENWHQLVDKTISEGIKGLENLALIPGCVGSAPIQNIGAYGVEFQKFADYVEVVELATGKITTVLDGQYGYRDSIFKHQYGEGYAIVYVGLTLAKQWQPVLAYGDLKNLNPATVTAQEIFTHICRVRQQKLPDPAVMGNGGSFFKNPVVPTAVFETMRANYPNIPHYPQASGEIKLAAGWLIDQCGLKGYQIGGACVHKDQALVLVNTHHQASAQDVVTLARYVRNRVAEKFSVWLEPEIRFMGKVGEIDAVKLLAQDS